MKSIRLLLPTSIAVGIIVACGTDKRTAFEDSNQTGAFNEAGALGEGGAEGGQRPVRDPVTCAEAETSKTYVGCDYWPTVTANFVQDAFDFAVAIANVGDAPANVTVTGPNAVNEKITVQPGSLGKVFLPWVPELKGNGLSGITASVIAKKGAYHLVSDVPVVVYQFNPLEFRAAGGPPGKDWSKCQKLSLTAPDCYSYSNDASLLLPSTAMTGNYRIMGAYGFSRHKTDENGIMDKSGPPQPGASPYFVVTATTDGTTVKVNLGPKGKVIAGGGINAAPAGGLLTFTLDAGDVAEVVSGMGRDYDFSGSLLNADKPVQVITGVPCIDFPLDITACDHVEETVFPAQTLGKHYVVITPTGPKENKVGHVVRFFGNVDGTVLKYKPSQPSGCPTSLNAGEVAECETTADFEVTGDHELGIATFMLGAEIVDPDKSQQQPQGDPSQSFAVAVEQYRLKYVFLAPTDYKTSYVDVVAPPGTNLDLDGTDVSPKLTTITGTGYVMGRLRLSNAGDGTHKLIASKPIGIQVMGYGDNTTYMYPGGLNLGEIAAVPPK